LGDAKHAICLKDYVLWESWKSRDDDIIISFTLSFLFSLQHCIHKIAKCWRTIRCNCYISVIDTSKYPQGIFPWIVDFLKRFDSDEKDDSRLLHKYHEAEYLAEYELVIFQSAGISVSFDGLVANGGFFDILPGFYDEFYKNQFWHRLQQFRRSWYHEEEEIISEDGQRTFKLALCFGDQWGAPNDDVGSCNKGSTGAGSDTEPHLLLPPTTSHYLPPTSAIFFIFGKLSEESNSES
jgi:hypothetical protein